MYNLDLVSEYRPAVRRHRLGDVGRSCIDAIHLFICSQLGLSVSTIFVADSSETHVQWTEVVRRIKHTRNTPHHQHCAIHFIPQTVLA